MKKLLSFIIACFFIVSAFAQKNEAEKKLGIKELPTEMMEQRMAIKPGRLDCNCSKNLVADPGFLTVTTNPRSTDISSTSAPWKVADNSPQYVGTDGACDKGYALMWGNNTVGESITQSLSLGAGTYNIKFNAKYISTPGAHNPYVKLRIGLGNSRATTTGFTYPTPINNTGWASYTFTFTTGGTSDICLYPVNDNTQNDGSYVSWIAIDNICIENACTIPSDKCTAEFSETPFTVNNQGNVVINVNPNLTSGVPHYWGLVIANGSTDISPIPLGTIISGGTFGLYVSPTGQYSSLGMGNPKTASTSGYGYNYNGVDVGRCFKITHYIKCCNGKWYSQTKTFCTKLCVETNNGTVKELTPEESKAAEAAVAVQGRG